MPDDAHNYRRILSILAIGSLFLAGSHGKALAEPRFGDSTWVAPTYLEIEGDPGDPGPRVAKPDHERPWETALRTPFRVAFLPLRLLARGIEATGPLVEKHIPEGAVSRTKTEKRGLKFSPELLGATVAMPQLVGPGSRVALTGIWAPSGNRKVKLRGFVGEGVSQVGAGFDALYDFRPDRRFYGIGNLTDSRATYFRRRVNLGSVYAFAGKNPMRRARVTLGISDVSAGRGNGRTPRSDDVFQPADAPFLDRGSKVWWYGSSADFAALDDTLEPSLGLHFRPDVRRFQSADGTNLEYDQWRFEARGYLPVFAKRRVLAGRLVYQGVDRRNGSCPIPFYRLPESTDENRFAAYPSGRFRDQRLAIGHAEYRWEIEPPLWAFLLGELAEVAPSSNQLSLRSAHPSLGGGLRARIGRTETARVQIAHGQEGMNLKLDLEAMF